MKYLLEANVLSLKEMKPSEIKGFDRITEMIQKLMKDIRNIMNNLRPSILDEIGLIPTIEWLSKEFQKTYGHIRVRKQLEAVEKDIPDFLRAVIFRVIQESLDNFAKHGEGDFVELSLIESGDTLQLRIRDNGRGFDVGKVKRGLGLESMQERVELSGGFFRVESAEGKGTAIRASWSIRGTFARYS